MSAATWFLASPETADMSSALETNIPEAVKRRKGEPTWEIAMLFPSQGDWSEEEYLALDTNRLIELTDGCLEFLPMPMPYHQLIAHYFWSLLHAYVTSKGLGYVLMAPLPVRLGPGTFREPDIGFFRPHQIPNVKRQPQGADLVVEVVSEGYENRKRDLETKRVDYAKAGIAEYWIIDPEERRISVLTLDGLSYREHGVFTPGTQATSVLLPGFQIDVSAAFAAGKLD